MPNEDRATAGNLMWCTAPCLPLSTRNGAAMLYPRAVACVPAVQQKAGMALSFYVLTIKACHHARPLRSDS